MEVFNILFYALEVRSRDISVIWNCPVSNGWWISTIWVVLMLSKLFFLTWFNKEMWDSCFHFFKAIHFSFSFFFIHLIFQQGHIVLIGSVMSLIGFVGYSSYAPTKWAIRGLADCLRNELLKFNINVSISYPPDTKTPGFAKELEVRPKELEFISPESDAFTPVDVIILFLPQTNFDEGGKIDCSRYAKRIVPHINSWSFTEHSDIFEKRDFTSNEPFLGFSDFSTYSVDWCRVFGIYWLRFHTYCSIFQET